MTNWTLPCALIIGIMAAPAVAADPVGDWALRAGATTLMLVEVNRTPSGWKAVWNQPTAYVVSPTRGEEFCNVAGPVVRRETSRARNLPDGGIEFRFPPAQPGWPSDRITVRPHDDGTARMVWTAFAGTPYRLTRVETAAALGPWNISRTYKADLERASDPEVTAIYQADQAARSGGSQIDWSKVAAGDATRRARMRVLLAEDHVASGDDYEHAAFIFQHGDRPEDYLLAHALAVIATARGSRNGAWIAAASLDRYLASIGKPQIYGTQFFPGTVGVTQGPYARDILSDAIREANNVSPLRDQAAELRRMNGDKP
ncbi:hypothetical protein [Sphingomonas echinoides]|uniref:hypothetical protein n=1 Tax=Sphingomonas echinoides TaxID=59803 RepID=UPI002413926B|nr:hypothetical protein [Sphingomonas echinoides]